MKIQITWPDIFVPPSEAGSAPKLPANPGNKNEAGETLGETLTPLHPHASTMPTVITTIAILLTINFTALN